MRPPCVISLLAVAMLGSSVFSGSTPGWAPGGLGSPAALPWASAAQPTARFGTADEALYVVRAFEFQPQNSAGAWGLSTATGVDRFTVDGGAVMGALRLPAGALVTRIELEA